jgi:hypothetical protein
MIKKMAMLVIMVSAGVAVAVASASTSHHFKQTGVEAGLVPNPHGIFFGTLGSGGAIREHRVQGAGVSYTGTTTLFEPQGSYSGKITAGHTTNMNTGFTETVKITRGAGLYKGASGKVTITGKHLSNSPGPFTTITVNGTIK